MFVNTNHIKLYCKVTGSGPPLVLLHGNGEDHHVFDKAVARLRRHFTCYMPDSRGHGQSSAVAQLHYNDMMEDVAGLIRACGLQKPHICGFSDGGIVALLLAAAHPELPGRLVVCGANTNPGQLRLWFRALATLGYLATGDTKLALMLREPHITAARLAAIRCPVLVLAGSRDILAGRHTRALAAAIPRATLRILRGQTHASYIRHAGRLCREMIPFLQEKTNQATVG